ncbi:AAA family ATPase [Symmachiella dynata]|uniref:AAA family ATPase n=1 Tax=Symmachiella dynata TaxID=2527995 RepID=UPI0030EB9620
MVSSDMSTESLLASLFAEKGVPQPSAPDAVTAASTIDSEFIPEEPTTFEEADLREAEVEALILKFLMNTASATGAEIAEQIKLPQKMIDPVLRRLKDEQQLVYKGMGSLNDYIHEITEIGAVRARRFSEKNTHFGSAPVSIKDYIAAIEAQSIDKDKPTVAKLQEAFAGLTMCDDLMRRVGRAIHSGRGLFLYGSPGNGKTSIAERITGAFGEHIWIPRVLNMYGEIVRLFDPSSHEELPLSSNNGLENGIKVDRRWIKIRRPTIIVGGELTMDNLEMTKNRDSGISEAPVQLKSNCGTLLIDDFGRQRMSVAELLNRWIVPLEKRYDILSMASGRKVRVPFDQMIVFSTNLDPSDLVDEAFLRRIPYKIEAKDPTESQFRELFAEQAATWNIELPAGALEHLIEQHYKSPRRNMRFCHPRDILQQVRNLCEFEGQPRIADISALDAAVETYFGIMYGTEDWV